MSNYEVNTDEVRRVAKEIREIAASVKQLSSRNVRTMRNNVKDNLEGETAEALNDVLAELSSDINLIGNGLDDIQQELMRYVRRVEEADRRAKELIES